MQDNLCAQRVEAQMTDRSHEKGAGWWRWWGGGRRGRRPFPRLHARKPIMGKKGIRGATRSLREAAYFFVMGIIQAPSFLLHHREELVGLYEISSLWSHRAVYLNIPLLRSGVS